MTNALNPSEHHPSSPAIRDLMERALRRHEEAANPNTKRAYEAGWAAFVSFCEDHDLEPLPATPHSVVLYAEHLAADRSYATIRSHLAAISKIHREEGHEDPTRSGPVEKQRANLRRTLDMSPDKKRPLLMKHLRQMDFQTDPPLKGLRDRALLFVGFAGGFRRSELSALEVTDIEHVEGGRIIRIGESKTDQEGQGQIKQIPDQVPGLDPTPNAALEAWLEGANIRSGAIFRGVDRWANVGEKALSGVSIYRIVRDYVEHIGLNPAHFGAHSLRAGYLTQGYIDGIGEQELADQTGHTSMDTVRDYQRVSVVLNDHPLSKMGTE